MAMCRAQLVALVRHIAIYLTRHMTKLSLKDIGKEFDNRDHTTILHSIDRVEKQCKTDPETNEVIKDIRSKALRSNNPCNVVRATIDGLSKLRNVDEVAAIRGKSAKQILG